MPTPVKILPGQKLISNFMQLTPSSPATAEATHTTSGQARSHDSARGHRHHSCTNTSPDESVPKRRRRRILTDDDDETIPTVTNNPAPVETIQVFDTSDESDANFGVYLNPLSQPSPIRNNSTPRQSQRVASKSQEEVSSVEADTACIILVVICAQTPNSDHDTKNEYEDEAEESENDDDFIDDAEPDESDEEAKVMTRETCESLRNRRKWKESEFECPLCADIRAILRLLLKRK